jgi:membrane protein implicated in regulation of membrane protease activity
MIKKKSVFVVGGVLVALALLTTIFIVVIVFLGLYTVKNSESAEKAQDYLRRSEKLKQDIGEVQKFGNIVTAAINDRNGNSEVTLKLKVFGERKTVNATVDLMLVQGNAWRVTSASYVNSNGQTVKLLDPYDTKVLIPSLTA